MVGSEPKRRRLCGIVEKSSSVASLASGCAWMMATRYTGAMHTKSGAGPCVRCTALVLTAPNCALSHYILVSTLNVQPQTKAQTRNITSNIHFSMARTQSKKRRLFGFAETSNSTSGPASSPGRSETRAEDFVSIPETPGMVSPGWSGGSGSPTSGRCRSKHGRWGASSTRASPGGSDPEFRKVSRQTGTRTKAKTRTRTKGGTKARPKTKTGARTHASVGRPACRRCGQGIWRR
ncbi:hypothetical protein EV401DRAFT_925616 [Pisolithus croceorrhizus]|nr:hypothetical protein EV401DRAFT_925616 [Pisolithus croceorrhizus]